MEPDKARRVFLRSDGWEQFGSDDCPTDQQKGLPCPPVQKPISLGEELVDLIAPEKITVGNAPLREIIGRRKSRRAFTQEPLTLEELSFLLWATQGVRERIERPSGTITYRTAPSGGSRHSFETYLCISRVGELRPGLYRYLPLDHKLARMSADPDLPAKVAKACCGQGFVAQSAVVFIWTTIPYRTEWRYRELSHKIIAQDSGHLCQNLYLAAESIGAGTCAIGAYFQDEMDALLGVDGTDELTIYAAPVGKI